MIVVAITIDTEVDHRGDAWVKTAPLRFRSVTEAIPGQLGHVFAAHRARPTYLLTSEVMDDQASVEVLRRVTDAELGTHLHGDHVQPEARVPNVAGAKSWDFNCCYPADLERAKLQTITDQFRDRFDRSPLSYRAGRYAASGRSARFLSELGYVADTSVTPRVRWVHEADPACTLEFEDASLEPYRPSERDLARPGALPIWEVPITILPRPNWWNFGVNVYQRLRSRPRVDYPVWLRPSTTSWPWLRWIVQTRLRTSQPPELTLFNIMFHSMEAVEGASPYSPTKRAANRILTRLDRMLALFESMGAHFLTLSELAAELDRRGGRLAVPPAA